MTLVNPIFLLKAAQARGAAIVAFNIHNMETIQAVMEAASEERSPVILQTTPGTLQHAGVSFMAALVKTAAETYDLPVALHLDHCPSYPLIIQCLRNGFTSVMIDASNLPYEENVAMVKKVVEVCDPIKVAVEGELGRIGGAEEELLVEEREAALTIPDEAVSYVRETGIHSLAVAIGTAHGEYKGEPKLDFPRLTAIRQRVDIPLVLHGASGVPDADIREAIRRGIAKINIATELKIPMAQALQDYFQAHPKENDPRKYMRVAKDRVKKVVQDKIRLCGASGLADEIKVRT